MNELIYASFGANTELFLIELRADMREGFARLEAKIDAARPPAWNSLQLAFDGFEKRITTLFFWYFMTLGIANAAIIVGMLKLLREL